MRYLSAVITDLISDSLIELFCLCLDEYISLNESTSLGNIKIHIPRGGGVAFLTQTY